MTRTHLRRRDLAANITNCRRLTGARHPEDQDRWRALRLSCRLPGSSISGSGDIAGTPGAMVKNHLPIHPLFEEILLGILNWAFFFNYSLRVLGQSFDIPRVLRPVSS